MRNFTHTAEPIEADDGRKLLAERLLIKVAGDAC